MKYLFAVVTTLMTAIGFGQSSEVLTLEEYLAYVKLYHPIVKQANLKLSESEAKLIKARGAFDPKVELQYDTKEFKSTEYYDRLKTSFKVPTWYGIEFKGGYESNSGTYLNPEFTVPEEGLYGFGVSVPLMKNLLINERMATLKRAKLYIQQATQDNQLEVNDILTKAALTYLKWWRYYEEKQVYESSVSNALQRYEGIRRSYLVGEKPAIDTTEARIACNNRSLSLDKATLNFVKAGLELSNYLWIEDVPMEITQDLIPDTSIGQKIDVILRIDGSIDYRDSLEQHPKVRSLSLKSQGLRIERKLAQNNLLPQVDLQYNLLTPTPEEIGAYSFEDYKLELRVSVPLFLRKSRAELKLADYKLQAIDYELDLTTLSIGNKLSSIISSIDSYSSQLELVKEMTLDYQTMLRGEETKFELGESSVFYVNTRESKLIQNRIKELDQEYLLLESKVRLYNLLCLP